MTNCGPYKKQGGAPIPRAVDLAAVRSQLAAETGQRYWRSLQELAGTQEFWEAAQREFPPGASEWADALSRRRFLSLAAASLALWSLTGCTKQRPKNIVPYVKQPEDLVLGEPMFYATTMPLGGFGQGILAKSYEGHPVKLEGNPEHPCTVGGSDVWLQASLMDLYDPDRSQSVAHNGEISTWDAFISDLAEMVSEEKTRKGAGLRFLTETITSPTLSGQLEAVLKQLPEAKWHVYEPVNQDNTLEGARLVFGKPMAAQHDFEKAAVILSLESDFLYSHPARLKYARAFTNARRVSSGRRESNRLYVAESSPTITGSVAEHRLPIRSSDIEALAWHLARECGLQVKSGAAVAPQSARQWLSQGVADLQQHRGGSIVIAGEWQPPIVHALAHALNEHLGNVGQTVFYTAPADSRALNQLASLQELVRDLSSGAVDALVILGSNPVYTSPGDVAFAQALSKAKRTIHLSTHLDETSAQATWHIPQAHFLEAWGDHRSFDGTVSLQQPLIEPLYAGKTAHEILDVFLHQQPLRSDYEIVRSFWSSQLKGGDFENQWRKAVHDGFFQETAFSKVDVRVNVGGLQSAASSPAASGDLELNFRPDPNIWDGRFANNGWLQECPKPISKLTWDNALLVSPVLAQREHLQTGDLVELAAGGRLLRGPVFICPGQAENCITCTLGYGRIRTGRVGNGVGINANAARSSRAPWFESGVKLRKLPERHEFAETQLHHVLGSPERQIYRAGILSQFLAKPDFVKSSVSEPHPAQTLFDPKEFRYDGYKWGMSIDLTTCIGCNACVLACDVENNIPVVGKTEVGRGRAMHWLRVDTYYEGSPDNPSFNHMPVPCMHCEHAPCELVCPVEATVHDHEGLNLQVYNRCVGTRFCSNNCPYKVRRFNFFQYAKYHEPSFSPMYNPDVTVRWRGVMEKCTYCIQRISRARITAEKDNRRIRDGEVRTACQQACPTEAITFGDLNDPNSAIAKLKRSPLDYSMLGELNTRPRTTYLAKVSNPKT
jgi:MoCo/4Fe-4S cofactor protein with predicted Tat translocation signal